MRAAKRLENSVMIKRGISALYKELGPVEARRFIATVHDMPHEDSVKRHHQWQENLDEKAFVKRIMAVQRS
jgi:hypothetical protein